MKKKSRRPRSTEASHQTSGTPNAAASSVSEEKKSSGSRGRPRKKIPAVTDAFYHENTQMEKPAEYGDAAEDTHKHGESKFKSSGRLSTATCRLCHGKFSPRSLRHAFNKWPQDSIHIMEDESDAVAQTPVLFHTDFQRLVGVQLDRDPRLSEFICKKCHAKFYKCHSILVRFLQRVNLPPVGKDNSKTRKTAKCAESSVNHGSAAPPSFTSDPKCLHSLVSWAHHHGEACRSCPDLKEVLEGQCWGSVKAVWGCVDGHKYIMDTRCDAAACAYAEHTLNFSSRALGSRDGSEEEEEHNEEEDDGNGRILAGSLVQHSPGPDPVTAQSQGSALNDWTGNAEDFSGQEESPAVAQMEDRMADSELSDRVVSEDEFDKAGLSDDELFEPYPDSKRPRSKGRQSLKTPEEPKTRKKPGPKPGWKNKFKPKGEELPNIYKCPYQGCTAVYRAPDGLKKHIREHHEEVRERPCPHPGCNKVFMIDRYLQRHVKLIHTEERNYICDQCGQTFKQRKHLSVHQMRHSGAKPLQCEVCGFQCRQRASLKYHMTKHKAEADLEFACLICGKRFEKAHNLNVHMSMVHPLTQVEAHRGNSQQQQQTYTDLHTITLTGEVVQHDQDR